MRILVQERRVREGQYVSRPMMFDIVLRPNCGESEEEVNEKGTRFRDKVDKLKPKGSWVGYFMPINEGEPIPPYAFFVITCPLGYRKRIKTIMGKSTKDGDLISFKQKDI